MSGTGSTRTSSATPTPSTRIPRNSPGSRRIRATSLNPATFSTFGDVVQNPATHNDVPKLESVGANQGSARKWLDVTKMRNWYEGRAASGTAAKCVVNMFVCQPRELRRDGDRTAFDVRVLERHPFTAQTFVPVGLDKDDKSTCYLVIVAPTLPRQLRDPPYPVPPRRRRSLKEILLGARPTPYSNEHAATTTPKSSAMESSEPVPKGSGQPDLDNIKAFIARGDQAVTYGPGTWHAPMVVLGENPIDFVVVQYANGVAIEDCQEVEIADGQFTVDLTDQGIAEAGIKAKL